MARGVDYETVKHTAVKLLSQGISPSVQKLRETLGTGSNTTLATHLNRWREEQANKQVHHLPETMPKELITTFEVLWQTAMEHAQQQFTVYKTDIEDQLELAQLDQREQAQKQQASYEKNIGLMKALEEKDKANQQLNIELSVLHERLEKTDLAHHEREKLAKTTIERLHQDKDNLLHQLQELKNELVTLNEKLTQQTHDHQQWAEEQRASQEQSENRWLKLIDQARQEKKDLQKQLNKQQDKYHNNLQQLQTKVVELQNQQIDHITQAKVNAHQLSQLKQEKKDLAQENKALTAQLVSLNRRETTKKQSKSSRRTAQES
jgi:DNA repair exonuclease SbcCD ATPase subunit